MCVCVCVIGRKTQLTVIRLLSIYFNWPLIKAHNLFRSPSHNGEERL